MASFIRMPLLMRVISNFLRQNESHFSEMREWGYADSLKIRKSRSSGIRSPLAAAPGCHVVALLKMTVPSRHREEPRSGDAAILGPPGAGPSTGSNRSRYNGSVTALRASRRRAGRFRLTSLSAGLAKRPPEVDFGAGPAYELQVRPWRSPIEISSSGHPSRERCRRRSPRRRHDGPRFRSPAGCGDHDQWP